MILVNVVAMVAVAAALVMAMLDREAPAVDRTATYRTAAQALAIARGGELSAVAALQRDGDSTRDDLTEAWARVAQPPTPIAGGSFALAITDAQGRFNVNAATGAGEPVLAGIVAALGLPPEVAVRIAGTVAARGRVRNLGELTRAGLDDATLARLRPLVTALPGDAPVNVNAAPAALLGVLVGDGVKGEQLARSRERAGRLTPPDLAAAGAELPPGAGFTSNHFLVTSTVTQGGTTVVLTSLLERRPEAAEPGRRRQPPAGDWLKTSSAQPQIAGARKTPNGTRVVALTRRRRRSTLNSTASSPVTAALPRTSGRALQPSQAPAAANSLASPPPNPVRPRSRA